MSNSWHEEARALAQKGLTQVEIAKQFNVSSGAVRFALNVNHMKERHSARTLKYHEEKRLLANKITAEFYHQRLHLIQQRYVEKTGDTEWCVPTVNYRDKTK